MEEEKIVNKVVLTLEEYLKLRDSKINEDKNINLLINLLFNCFELTKDKKDLRFETYKLSESRTKALLKELNPGRYIETINLLQQEGED